MSEEMKSLELTAIEEIIVMRRRIEKIQSNLRYSSSGKALYATANLEIADTCLLKAMCSMPENKEQE